MALAMGSSLLGRSVPRQLLPRALAPLCGQFLDGACTLYPSRALVALPQAGCRFYSSESSGQRKQLMVLGVPNPFLWLRNRVHYFLIRAFFDRDFSIEEFNKGARQAFTIVSKLLSQCNFDALKELVVAEVLQALKEKSATMPESHKLALAADSNEILYLTPGNVEFYYDDNNDRKFVIILMHFWYLTSANLPEENTDGTKVFQTVLGDGPAKDSKRLLTANYEFRREFTKGAASDWIITRIEYSKLIN